MRRRHVESGGLVKLTSCPFVLWRAAARAFDYTTRGANRGAQHAGLSHSEPHAPQVGRNGRRVHSRGRRQASRQSIACHYRISGQLC